MYERRPITRNYNPGYPGFLSEEAIRELLRPGLLRRFSKETVLAGALLAGVPAASARAVPQGRKAPAEVKIKSTRYDAKLRKEVEALVGKVLREMDKKADGWSGYWESSTSLVLKKVIPSNPPIKCPEIPISFGNSMMGIFDVDTAKKATVKLFQLYGIHLKKDVPLRADGYRFEADGFNKKERIGFEIIVPEKLFSPNFGEKKNPIPEDEKLDDKELKELEKDLESGKRRFFVSRADLYPNMDYDLRTPMFFYLASVVDYLNWVHGDKAIDTSTVLGRIPAGIKRNPENPLTRLRINFADSRLPGCSFQDEKDLGNWKILKGRKTACVIWPGSRTPSMEILLDPGGAAVYTPPNDVCISIRRNAKNLPFGGYLYGFRIYVAKAREKKVSVSVSIFGEGNERYSSSQKIPLGLSTLWIAKIPNSFSIGRLKKLEIRTDSTEPVTFYIDDVGIDPLLMEKEKARDG